MRATVFVTGVRERAKPQREAMVRVVQGVYPEIAVGDDGCLDGTCAMTEAGSRPLRKQLGIVDGWSWIRWMHPRMKQQCYFFFETKSGISGTYISRLLV